MPLVEDSTGQTRNTYQATLAPSPALQPGSLYVDPDGTATLPSCNDNRRPVRDVIIGVYGAVPARIGGQGLAFELTVDVRPRTLQIGVQRDVAIVGETYSAFLLPVPPGQSFTATATVLNLAGTVITVVTIVTVATAVTDVTDVTNVTDITAVTAATAVTDVTDGAGPRRSQTRRFAATPLLLTPLLVPPLLVTPLLVPPLLVTPMPRAQDRPQSHSTICAFIWHRSSVWAAAAAGHRFSRSSTERPPASPRPSRRRYTRYTRYTRRTRRLRYTRHLRHTRYIRQIPLHALRRPTAPEQAASIVASQAGRYIRYTRCTLQAASIVASQAGRSTFPLSIDTGQVDVDCSNLPSREARRPNREVGLLIGVACYGERVNVPRQALVTGEVSVSISVSECARTDLDATADEVWYFVLQPWNLQNGEFMRVRLS